jgi:hypothetical protein
MNKKTGIFIAVIAVILFSVAVTSGRAQDVTSGKYLGEIASELNKNLPMMVDKETEWISTAGLDRVIIYNYRLVNYNAADLSSAELVKSARPMLTNAVCSTPETRDSFIKKGISMRYVYNDKNRVHVASIEITPKDCGF